MSPNRCLLLLACCCLALVALPAAAAEPAEPVAATPAPATEAPAACPAVLAGLPDPIQLAPCMVSVQCSDGSSVACNGNSSCSTSGPSGRCVTCDGVQQGCCELTLCEQCTIAYEDCMWTCQTVFECNKCDNAYARCRNNLENCPP